MYDHERRLIYQETRAAGRPRALAGVGSIYRHFGSWLAALEEAGIGGTRNPASIGLHLGDRQIVRALAKACAATTGWSTIQQYMAWRRRKLALDPTRHSDLPSYITIYRRFGSWRAALQAAAAHLEPVSGDANEPRLGNEPFRPTTERDQQIVRALAEAHAATTGPLTIQQYTAWRREELVRDPTRRTDLPSYGTIYQRFGSWRTALQVAGADLEQTSGDANEPRLGNEQFPPTTERGQQIVPALAEAHAATTGALTVLRSLSWREQQLARDSSRRDELPSLSTIYRSFGSFSAALHAAGIDLGRIRGRAQGGRFSDEQLLRILNDADVATAGGLSVDQYLAWREEQSAGDPALRKSLPINTTFQHRFGSWTKALERVRRWRGQE